MSLYCFARMLTQNSHGTKVASAEVLCYEYCQNWLGETKLMDPGGEAPLPFLF